MKELRISSEAERDLDDIWQYLSDESNSPSVANRFIDQADCPAHDSGTFGKGGTQERYNRDGSKSTPDWNYIVYYRERGRFVTVARLIHGKREQAAAFSEDAG